MLNTSPTGRWNPFVSAGETSTIGSSFTGTPLLPLQSLPLTVTSMISGASVVGALGGTFPSIACTSGELTATTTNDDELCCFCGPPLITVDVSMDPLDSFLAGDL